MLCLWNIPQKLVGSQATLYKWNLKHDHVLFIEQSSPKKPARGSVPGHGSLVERNGTDSGGHIARRAAVARAGPYDRATALGRGSGRIHARIRVTIAAM